MVSLVGGLLLKSCTDSSCKTATSDNISGGGVLENWTKHPRGFSEREIAETMLIRWQKVSLC